MVTQKQEGDLYKVIFLIHLLQTGRQGSYQLLARSNPQMSVSALAELNQNVSRGRCTTIISYCLEAEFPCSTQQPFKHVCLRNVPNILLTNTNRPHIVSYTDIVEAHNTHTSTCLNIHKTPIHTIHTYTHNTQLKTSTLTY